MLQYFLITFGIIIGLSSIGVGLLTIVSNFVSGLILLFERSLRVGDFVELNSGVTGEATEINVRSTLVTTNDNVDVLIPNSEFIGGKMINWTLTDSVRRIHEPFGVAYGSNKDTVLSREYRCSRRDCCKPPLHPGASTETRDVRGSITDIGLLVYRRQSHPAQQPLYSFRPYLVTRNSQISRYAFHAVSCVHLNLREESPDMSFYHAS
ncbi:MAG: mechanosensitive ion channel family protein [Gammaproteobacteria bacterium]